MNLFAFGDSWTEGIGSNIKIENKLPTNEEKTKFRNANSWPFFLSQLLSVPVHNYGIGACSNKVIFDLAAKAASSQVIKEGDLVVIMWSSSIRDNPPFFPEDNHFQSWSQRLLERKSYIVSSNFTKDSTGVFYDSIKTSYRNFFIEHLFDSNYYSIVNQYYITYLQFLFDNLGIRYLFCDAFDLMIEKNFLEELDKTKHINTQHYWNFRKKTFRDFLLHTGRQDVWQDGTVPSMTQGQHPSSIGYKLIAEELYKYITSYNILNYKLKEKSAQLI